MYILCNESPCLQVVDEGFGASDLHFIPLLGDNSVISCHSFLPFWGIPFTFYKINKLSPSNLGNSSLNFLFSFQFSCLPTVDNLHLHMSHTVDTNDATQSISHHNHTQPSWLYGLETRLSIIPVNASVTHMVLALSRIIGSGPIPCLCTHDTFICS